MSDGIKTLIAGRGMSAHETPEAAEASMRARDTYAGIERSTNAFWREPRGSSPSLDEAFDLVRAKMDEAIADHRAQLNRDMFASGQSASPLPRRSIWRAKYWRVRAYVSTLWDALRGRDPFESEDY